MPTTCVWLDGLVSNTTEQFLTRHFCRYGHVVKVSMFTPPHTHTPTPTTHTHRVAHCYFLISKESPFLFCCGWQVVFDRMKGTALILYNNTEYAQAAVKDTKGWKIGGNKIKAS